MFGILKEGNRHPSLQLDNGLATH